MQRAEESGLNSEFRDNIRKDIKKAIQDEMKSQVNDEMKASADDPVKVTDIITRVEIILSLFKKSESITRSTLDINDMDAADINNVVWAAISKAIAAAKGNPLVMTIAEAFSPDSRQELDGNLILKWHNNLRDGFALTEAQAGRLLTMVVEQVFIREAERLGTTSITETMKLVRRVAGDLAAIDSARNMEQEAGKLGTENPEAVQLTADAAKIRQAALEGSFLGALEQSGISGDGYRQRADELMSSCRIKLKEIFNYTPEENVEGKDSIEENFIQKIITAAVEEAKALGDRYVMSAELKQAGLSREFFDMLGYGENDGVVYTKIPDAPDFILLLDDLAKFSEHLIDYKNMLKWSKTAADVKGYDRPRPKQLETIGYLMYREFGITEGLTGGGKTTFMSPVLALYFWTKNGRSSCIVFPDEGSMRLAFNSAKGIFAKAGVTVKMYEHEGKTAEEALASIGGAQVIFVTQQGLQSALLQERLGAKSAFEPFRKANFVFDEVDTLLNVADLIMGQGGYSIGEKFPEIGMHMKAAVQFLVQEFNGDFEAAKAFVKMTKVMADVDADGKPVSDGHGGIKTKVVDLKTSERYFDKELQEKLLKHLQNIGLVPMGASMDAIRENPMFEQYAGYLSAFNYLAQRLTAEAGPDYNYRKDANNKFIKAPGSTVPGDVFSHESRVMQHFSNAYMAAAYDAITQIEGLLEKPGRSNSSKLTGITTEDVEALTFNEVKVDPTSQRVSMADVFSEIKESYDELKETETPAMVGFSGDLTAWVNPLKQLYGFDGQAVGGEFSVKTQRNMDRITDERIKTLGSDPDAIMDYLFDSQKEGNYILNVFSNISSEKTEMAFLRAFRETNRVVRDNEGNYIFFKAGSMDGVRIEDCQKIFLIYNNEVNLFIQRPSTRGLDVYTPEGVRPVVLTDKGVTGRALNQAIGRVRGLFGLVDGTFMETNFETADNFGWLFVFADAELAANGESMTRETLLDKAQANHDVEMKLVRLTKVIEAASSMYRRVITDAAVLARRAGTENGVAKASVIADELDRLILDESRIDSLKSGLLAGDLTKTRAALIQALLHSFTIEERVMRMAEQGGWFEVVPGMQVIFESACGKVEGLYERSERPLLNFRQDTETAKSPQKEALSLDKVRNTRQLVEYINYYFKEADFPEYANRAQGTAFRSLEQAPATLGELRTRITQAKEQRSAQSSKTDVELIKDTLLELGWVESTADSNTDNWSITDAGKRFVMAYIKWTHMNPDDKKRISRMISLLSHAEGLTDAITAAIGSAEQSGILDNQEFIRAYIALASEQVVDVYADARNFDQVMDLAGALEAFEVILGNDIPITKTELLRCLDSRNAVLTLSEIVQTKPVFAAADESARVRIQGSEDINKIKSRLDDANELLNRLKGYLVTATEEEKAKFQYEQRIAAAEEQIKQIRSELISKEREVGKIFDENGKGIVDLAIQLATAAGADKAVEAGERMNAGVKISDPTVKVFLPYLLTAVRLFHLGMKEQQLIYVLRTRDVFIAACGQEASDNVSTVSDVMELMRASIYERVKFVANYENSIGYEAAVDFAKDIEKGVDVMLAQNKDNPAARLASVSLALDLASGRSEVKNKAAIEIKRRIRANGFTGTERQLDEYITNLSSAVNRVMSDMEENSSLKETAKRVSEKLSAKTLNAIVAITGVSDHDADVMVNIDDTEKEKADKLTLNQLGVKRMLG